MTNTPRRRRPVQRPHEPAPSEDTMTSQTLQPELLVSHVEPETPAVRQRSLRALRPLSPVPTVTGVVVCAFGLLLIAVAWSQVAGEADVSRQVPYLVSGGIFGLALVLIGLTTVNIASKRRETALREQQAELLADAVDQLSRVLRDDLPDRA